MQELGAQKSPQGIAALAMGNPAPLQQRVQQGGKDPQTGLPRDLVDALALNIVTNEQDAAKRQMAMQQLQQAAGPTGQMPTVVDSLRQQAQQKVAALQQAQAQQAQQAQQAMQAPQQAPQQAGIDQLPASFSMAGGGIVAFDGTKGSVPKDEDKEKAKDKDAPLDEQAASDRAALGRLWDKLTSGSEYAGRAIADIATLAPRGLVGAYDTAVVRPMRAAGLNAAYLSPKLVPEGVSPDSMTPFTDVARRRDAANSPEALGPVPDTTGADVMGGVPGTLKGTPVGPSGAPGPVRDLRQAAEQQARRQAAAPGAGPAAPVDLLDKLYRDKLAAKMQLDPEARAKALGERAAAEYGAPDTSTYDRLMSEYEARKQKLNAPKAGWDAFSEYMGDVAAAGRGRKWYESGAQASAVNEQRQKDRELQQFELTKQMLDVAQKKSDAERGYKKELFGLKEKERDDIDKQVQEAVKEYGLNKREAEKLKAELERVHIAGKYQLQAAAVRGAGGGDKQQLAELKALQDSLEKQLKTTFSVKDRQQIQSDLNRVNAAVAKMAGVDTMATAPGAGSPGGTTPAAGTVMDGYRFKGGNPADKSNWEKV